MSKGWDDFCKFTEVDINKVKKELSEKQKTVPLTLFDDLAQQGKEARKKKEEENKKHKFDWNEIWKKKETPKEHTPVNYVHPNDPSLYDENAARYERAIEEYVKTREFWKYVNGGSYPPGLGLIPTGYKFNTPDGKSRSGMDDYYDGNTLDLSDPISVSIAAHNAVNNSKWNRPIGEQYLAARGPFEVHFDNPNGKKLTDKFEKVMNRRLNDPQYIADQLSPIKKQQPFVRPLGEDRSIEDLQDDAFDDETVRNKKLAEEEKKSKTGIGLGTISNNSDLNKMATKITSFGATNIIKKYKDEVTPYISEKNLNKATGTSFKPVMTRDKFLNDVMLYNAQKKALMGQSILPGNPYPSIPSYKFGNSTERMPEFSLGYGYYGVAGHPDKNGLPTEWFNDNNRWLIPSKEDYSSGKVPTVIVNGHIHGLKNIEEINKAKEKYKKPIDKSGVATVYISKTTVNKSGEETTVVYNGKTGKELTKEELGELPSNSFAFSRDDYKFFSVHRTPYNKNYTNDNGSLESKSTTYYQNKYLSLIDDVKNQLNEDSVTQDLTLVRELARYNEPLADRVEWLRDNLSDSDMNDLKTIVLEQFRKYREKDPLALIKMTVFEIAGNRLLATVAKPTTDSELKEFLESAKKVYNEKDYLRTKEAIESTDDIEKKVQNLKAIRDLEVIPKKDDIAYQEVLKLMEKCTDLQKNNFDTFSFYKKFFKYTFKSHMDDYEKWFHEWWMKPRKQLTQKEYEKEYNDRMTKFAGKHWNKMWDNTVDASSIYNNIMNDILYKEETSYKRSVPITNNSTLSDIIDHFTYHYNDLEIKKSIKESPFNKKFFNDMQYDPKKFDKQISYDNNNHTIIKNYERAIGGSYDDPDYVNYLQTDSPEIRRKKFLDAMVKKCSEMPLLK